MKFRTIGNNKVHGFYMVETNGLGGFDIEADNPNDAINKVITNLKEVVQKSGKKYTDLSLKGRMNNWEVYCPIIHKII